MLFAAAAAATAIPIAAPPPSDDMNAPRKVRTGIVLGVSAGGGFAAGSGYPNDSTQIGDPTHHSASPWLPGTNETVFAMGALADYLNFGFWFGHALFQNGDWRTNGDGGGLRVEIFPLLGWYPRLSNLGVLAQFGTGSATLTSRIPGRPSEAEGTQSFIGAGVFYEWSFWQVLGGHFAVGPSLEYDAIFSLPFERHGLVADGRLVFYGGP
jgi:hypothetical protein